MKCLLEQQKSLELAINKGKNERERRAKSADPASDSSRPSTPKTGEHYAISLLFGPEDDPRRTVITVRTLKKRDKNNKQLLDKSQKEQEPAEGQKEEAAVAAAVAVLEGPSTSRAAAQAHAMLDTPTKQGENHEEKAHTKDAKNTSLPTPIEIFAAPTKKAARTKYRNHSEIQRRNTVCIDTVTKIKDDGFTSIFDKSDITPPAATTKHCKESISTQSDNINSLNSTLPDASPTKLSDPTPISNPLQAAKSAAKMKAKFRTMELAAAAQEKLQKQAKLLEERNQSRLSAMKKSAIQEEIQRTSEIKIDIQKPIIKEELPTIAKTHETERKEKQRELMRLERERLEKQRRLISDAKIKKENEIVIHPLDETKLVKSNETKFSVEGKKEKRKLKSNSFSDGCEKKRRPAGQKDTLEIENTIDAPATEVKNENLPKEREESRPKIGTKTSPIKKQTEIKDAIKQENELSGLPTKELKEICHTIKNEKETTNSAQKSVKEKGKPGLKPRKLSAVDHGVETSDNKNIRKRSYESHDSDVNTPPKKKKDTTENYCSTNKMTQNETKSELYKRKCEYNKDDHVKEREIGKDRKERERDREEKDPRGKERSKQRIDEREQKKDRPSFQNLSFTKKRRTSFDNDKNFKYSTYNSRNNTRDAWETSRDERRSKSRVVDTRNSRPPYRPSVDSRNGSHMRNMPHRQTIDSRLPVNNVAPNWRNRRDSIDVRYNNNNNNRRDSVRENISERPPFNRDYRPRFLPDSVHFNGPTPPIPPMARRESISVPYAHHKRHQQGSNTFAVPFAGTMLPTQQNRYQSLIDQRNNRPPPAKVIPTPNPMEETLPLNKDSTETFLAPHLPARFRAETPITETFPYSSLPTFNNSIYVPASGSIPGNNVMGRPATLGNKGNISISPFKNLFSQSPLTASTPITATNLNSTVFGSVVSLQSTVEPSKTLPIKNSINELLTRLKNKDNRSLTNIYENKQIVQWGANTDPRLTRSGSPVLPEIGDKNNSSFESVKNESMETDRKTKKVSLKEYRQRHKSFVPNNEGPAPFDNDTVKVRNFQDFIETEKVASACSSYSPHSPTPERVILPTENDVFTVNLTDVKNNYESDNNLNENPSTPRITENSEISVEKLQSDPYTSLFGMKAFSDKPTELEKAQENMSHRFISSRLAFKSPTSEHNIIAGGESSCSNKNDKSSTTPTFSQMLDDVSSGSSDSNMIVTEMTNLDAIKESVAQEDTKSQEKTAKRGNSEQKHNKKMDKKIKERKNADDKLKKDNQLKIKMGDLQMNTSDKDKTKSRATKEKMTDEEKRLQAKMALMAAAALTTSAMSDREA